MKTNPISLPPPRSIDHSLVAAIFATASMPLHGSRQQPTCPKTQKKKRGKSQKDARRKNR